MPRRPPMQLSAVDAELRTAFDAARAELHIRLDYPAEALAEARTAAARPLDTTGRLDARHLPLLTLDPVGSRDLDQALHLERRGDGYRVHYAIADLTEFVTPGGPLDGEVHDRGVTYYAPDRSAPLHPRELSEGAASLLAGEDRPCVLWSLDLDSDANLVRTEVQRALVRSRVQLDYGTAQGALDAGAADPSLPLLAEVGRLREQRAADRGAVALHLPEQVVDRSPDGRWQLSYRAPLPLEGWNAEISLLTGMAAAQLMLDAGVGLLRTLPPPSPQTVEGYRRSALALGANWSKDTSYGEFVSSLDPADPVGAALLRLATMLVRGAGYASFDGAPPDQPLHSAVAAPYAHVTAPLRRLADRYAGEVCRAVCAGEEVADWVRAALPRLPEEMAAADHRAHALDRAVVDVAEAVLLRDQLGQVFDAVVVEADHKRAEVQLRDPAVRGRCDGAGLRLGEELSVRLAAADPRRREVRFTPA